MGQGLWGSAVELCILSRASLAVASVASCCQEVYQRTSGLQGASMSRGSRPVPPLDPRIKIPLVFYFWYQKVPVNTWDSLELVNSK